MPRWASAAAAADVARGAVGCACRLGRRSGVSADTVIVLLGARHGGIVSREQLLAAGITRHEIEQRTRDGRLQILYPGIYAVGHRALRPEALRLAAVLAGGRGAVLSHRSAATARGFGQRAPARHEITAPLRRARHPHLTIHRRRLTAADVTLLDGIPVTTTARTMLDLAATRPRSEVEAALEAATRLDLVDLLRFDDILTRHRGRPGVAVLRDLVSQLHPQTGATRSRLEVRALRLVERLGLPRPAVNAVVAGLEVDLLWPRERLAVELDSRAHHDGPIAFERDRRRDATLAAAGYRTLRFSWRQVTGDEERVAAALRAALRAAPRHATPPPGPDAAAA